MRHEYLQNTPLPEAKSKYISALLSAGFAPKTAMVPTADALGLKLAKAAYAAISSPHYNASAMDGVAVLAKDTFGAGESTPVLLSPRQYTVVDTGDPLPDGCDAVVMIEDVREEENGVVRLHAAVSPWTNVRQVGEDLCMGDMIAPSGTLVTPALIGALLAGGLTGVEVVRRPKFGIIPTGDEIVAPTAHPKKGDVLEFNSAIFSAELKEAGADVCVYPITPDKKDLLEAAIKTALSECDAVLILAGSSAGRDDYTSSLIASLGELVLHGVAVRPGKPVALGHVGEKPVIGLPGYPVSAMVATAQFVLPLVELWFGRSAAASETVEATLVRSVVSSLKYEEFIRVTLGKVGDTVYAVPLPRGAGVITSVTKAGGLLRVPQNSEGYPAGTRVKVRLLVNKEDLERTLVITGSHDPLIDEVADEVNRRGLGFRIVSSHVGSMGALTSVGAKQAHLGACHLLDEKTGNYNDSYVAARFPNGGARLVKGVGRVQGLMVAPGNPLGIRDIPDLVGKRFVNRQLGAGTRVLFDHLLKTHGLVPAEIAGYTNVKFTHTAVAAAVAAGNADAGMGILSAARLYGLDFIPLWNEEYDFLVGEDYINDPMVTAFFDVLFSEELRNRLTALGGYTLPESEGKGGTPDGADASE